MYFKPALAALLAASIGLVNATGHAAPGYRIHTIDRKPIQLSISVAGTVTARKTVQLSAQMPGRITSIAGEEGDTFATNTILITLDDRALRARLEAAHAQRDASAAAMRNARAQYDREIRSPRSDSSGSAPGGMGMPAMMDQMFTNPMQNMTGMRSRGTERRSDLVSAETQIAQADTQYKQAVANIKEIEAMLRDTKSVAPFSGVIEKVHVEVGDTVQPGQPIIDFAESGAYLVEADLPVRLVKTLQPGQAISVILDSNRPAINAAVSRIHPIADKRQHTVRVELTLPSDVQVTAGQYAELKIPDSSVNMPAQLTIPKSAVITKGGLPLVYAVDKAGKARLRVVRLGDETNDNSRIVLSGINENDRIIDQPPAGLRAGTQVVGAPASPADNNK